MPKASKTRSEPRQASRRSPWPLGRIWALALVTFRQAVRARLWILVPPAIAILVIADLSSRAYDPVFETIPATFNLSILVMTVVALMLAVFFATYSLPTELESKIAYTVMTKPVGRAEAIAGKTLGMSLVILAAVGLVGVGAYIHIHIRASGVHATAQARLAEARSHAPYPADLAALESVAARGPLQTYRYTAAATGLPVMGVDLGPTAPAQAGAQWVLGGTGVQLEWPLGDAPLREWVAGGPGRIHLSLHVVQPADKPPAPTTIVIALLPEGVPMTRDRGQEGPDKLIYQLQCDVPPGGELDVPIAGPGQPPAPQVLNCPPAGHLVLRVAVLTESHALGGGPGVVRLIGPKGQLRTLTAPPIAGLATGQQRFSLAGRTQAPRQTATFRLADVPESALGDGPATIEASFGVDAWAPATVQPEARITFIRPDGKELAVPFTPDSHNPTRIAIDTSFWRGGTLLARVQCQTDDDYLNLSPESLRLRQDGGPFVLNFAKAVLRVWFFGTVLAALAVALSTRLSWFVGILATAFVLFLMTLVRSFLMVVLGLKFLAYAPDPRGLLPDTSVSLGQVMSAPEFLAAVVVAAVAVAVLTAIGTVLLKTREVAA